jgi:soluble lytic murein transglycosylase-like protein
MIRSFVFGLSVLAVATPAFASGSYDSMVSAHAASHGVPESLVRRVIKKESGGNARAVSAGNYGLMQIRLGTARSMGYSGSAAGLLDPNTNMTYAVKYLAGAYRAAGGNADLAVRYYQGGYHGRGASSAAPSGAYSASRKSSSRNAFAWNDDRAPVITTRRSKRERAVPRVNIQ